MKKNDKAKKQRKAAALAFDIEVGKRIGDIRRKRDVSLDKMSKLVGVSVSQLYRYESGFTSCESFMLASIAKVLCCLPGAFLDGIEVNGK